jgi:hypothetical protein
MFSPPERASREREKSVSVKEEELRGFIVTFNQVLSKLRQFQPAFEDEDVARPQIQLHRSPSRHASEDAGDGGASAAFELGNLRVDPLSPQRTPELSEALVAITNLAEALDVQKLDKKQNMVALIDFIKSSFRSLSNFENKRRNAAAAALGGGTRRVPGESASEHLARAKAWWILAQCVESTVVYFNTNQPLMLEMLTKSETLILMLKILEKAKFLVSGEQVDIDCPISLKRSTRELTELEGYLLNHAVPRDITAKMVSSYAQEFLVDAAVPPAVCSGRHEAASEYAVRQRSVMITHILYPKSATFLQTLATSRDYGHVASLLNLSLSATYKSRQKLCDRLSADGLLKLIAQDIFPRRSSQRKLIQDPELLTCAIDILAVFSRPPEEGEDIGSPQPPNTVKRPRKRQGPTWADDEGLSGILQGCFDILSETSPQARGGPNQAFILGITEVIVNCLRLESQRLSQCVLELVDAALEHFPSRCVHRLLPIIMAFIQSSFIAKRGNETWVGIVGGWFGSVLIHAPYSNSRNRYADRLQIHRVVPYLKFAAEVVESKCQIEGTRAFLERTLSTAEFLSEITRHQRAGANLLTSVIRKTITCLRAANVEASSPPRQLSSATAMFPSISSPSSKEFSPGRTNSSRKRSRSPSVFQQAFSNEEVEEEAAFSDQQLFSPGSITRLHPEPGRTLGSWTSSRSERDRSLSQSAPTQQRQRSNQASQSQSHPQLDSASDSTPWPQRSRSPLSGMSPADQDPISMSPIMTSVAAKGVQGLQATWNALRTLAPFGGQSKTTVQASPFATGPY